MRIGGERSLLIDQAAQALGVSRRTVYYRIREGKLKTIRAKCGSQRVLWSSIQALRDVKNERSGALQSAALTLHA
jgi:excisionase family DNA binding protein